MHAKTCPCVLAILMRTCSLDYPGIGPEHAFFKDAGRAEYHAVTDEQALEGFKLLSRAEGILPVRRGGGGNSGNTHQPCSLVCVGPGNIEGGGVCWMRNCVGAGKHQGPRPGVYLLRQGCGHLAIKCVYVSLATAGCLQSGGERRIQSVRLPLQCEPPGAWGPPTMAEMCQGRRAVGVARCRRSYDVYGVTMRL